MVYERPRGLKNNILYSYKSPPMNSTPFYDGCPGKDKSFHRFLYSLCLFDVTLQERKRFGTFRWNNDYDFNIDDLQLCLQQVKSSINQTEGLPLGMLSYLVGECVYGGRISDELDHQLLRTYLSDYLNEGVVNGLTQFHGTSELYAIPKRLEYKEVVRYVCETVSNDPPCEAFGLHPNADLVNRLDEIDYLFHSISLTVSTSERSSFAESFDENLAEKAREIIQRIPKKKKIPTGSDSNDMVARIYCREIECYNSLACEIADACEQIIQSIEGKCSQMDISSD